MLFSLSQNKAFFNDPKEVEELEKLGFQCEKIKDDPMFGPYYGIKEIKDSSIEINTLEELVEFVKKYGKIVLTEDEIEIYNDYRE